jgi:hypothetical protein
MGSGAQRCVAQHGRDGARCIARPCSPTLPSVARRCVARGVQHCAAMVDEELRASVCGATENYRLGAVRWPLRIAALTGACSVDCRASHLNIRFLGHGRCCNNPLHIRRAIHHLVDRGSTATTKGEVHLADRVGVQRMTRALGTNLYVRRKRSWSETNQSDVRNKSIRCGRHTAQ